MTCGDCWQKMGEKVPLLARSIGGRVLGPRPGLAIVTFWQGIVEIFLRLGAAVMCAAALIPACIAYSSSGGSEVHGSAGFILGIASVGLVWELCLIALRFVNIGVINYKSKWLFITDFVLSVTLSVLFLAGCAAAAFASNEANKEGSGAVVSALIAATVMSFFAAIFLAIAGTWSILFMWFKWNKHVVTYTLRNAVLG